MARRPASIFLVNHKKSPSCFARALPILFIKLIEQLIR